jgi:hypothetical protein
MEQRTPASQKPGGFDQPPPDPAWVLCPLRYVLCILLRHYRRLLHLVTTLKLLHATHQPIICLLLRRSAMMVRLKSVIDSYSYPGVEITYIYNQMRRPRVTPSTYLGFRYFAPSLTPCYDLSGKPRNRFGFGGNLPLSVSTDAKPRRKFNPTRALL